MTRLGASYPSQVRPLSGPDQYRRSTPDVRTRRRRCHAGGQVIGRPGTQLRQPPSGLFAMKSWKFGRTYPGSLPSRMSVFIVPNVVSGLSFMPS